MRDITQSTAKSIFFLMIDATDHLTGKTGLSPTVKISKNGAAGAAPAGAVTEIDATNLPGWYQLAATAADTGTLGALLLHAAATGADPIDQEWQIVAYNPNDAAALGLSRIDAAVSLCTADALLGRNQQGGSNTAPHVSDALAGGLMKFTINTGTGVLTVLNGDGSTAYTRTLSRSALDAIVGST